MNRPVRRLLLTAPTGTGFLSSRSSQIRRFETWPGQRYDEDFLRPFRKSGHNFMRCGVVERIVTNLDTLSAVQKRKIPQGYLSGFAEDVVGQSHLRWLMQKDALRQDALLAVPDGAGIIQCRRLAMAYAELVQRPVDLLTITSHTTVHDVLHRRVFVEEGNAKDSNSLRYRGYVWEDQAAVQAALGGHILILDGLHRAERNVMSALNSLLANRELCLEDGRTLICRELYLTLKEEGRVRGNLNVVPISDNFRVIALWSRKFDRLDPETRSRFQICRVDMPPSGLVYEKLLWSHDGDVDPKGKKAEEKKKDLISVSIPIPDESRDFEIPDISREKSAEQLSLIASVLTDTTVIKNDGFFFPLTSLSAIHRIRTHFPQTPLAEILYRAFPYASPEARLRKLLDRWPMAVLTRKWVQYVLEDLRLAEGANDSIPELTGNAYTFQFVEAIPGDPYNVYVYWSQRKQFNKQGIFASMFKDYSLGDVRVKVASGGLLLKKTPPSSYITTEVPNELFTAMFQEHFAGRDILLIAPQGEEKSIIQLANHFCSLTGYEALVFPLHEEITPMGLLQQKPTASSPTEIAESPLLKAACSGQVCILDGIEKVSAEVMATLQGFLTDRQIVFPDGLKYILSQTDGDLGHKVQRIHPSFRVIAIATIPALGVEDDDNPSPPTWLSEEVVSMFATVPLPAPRQD
jgi:MoxR-like ATPase